ncbi:MAG: hypothetical protein LUG91_05475 [Ruminococcus sp.]|nr:hypothetical protein [Ruminococcus sp.]
MNEYRYLKGSEEHRESVEFDLCGSENNTPTTCVIDVDLLLCGVEIAPCGNGDDIELTQKQIAEILQFVKVERERIITATTPKSYESWQESGIGQFEEYFRVGDEVTEELVDYFMNLLPPTFMNYGMLQVGEPYSSELDPDTNKWKYTYTTFAKSEGKWKYVGECFYKQNINRIKYLDRLELALTEIKKEAY